jgi:MFS family permease
MDWMMLSLALPFIKVTFNLSLTELGLLATTTLAGAALGGIVVGILADYLGRVRVLMYTMLWYAILTAACGFSQSYTQLMILRFLVGIGLGGEWGVGSALVSEYWPAERRARATSLVQSGWPLGYGLAALLFMFIVPLWGWRCLFFVGIVPAFIAMWVRASVPEPEAWVESRSIRLNAKAAGAIVRFPLLTLFTAKYLRTTILTLILVSGALMAFWGTASWLPSYLAMTKKLNIIKTGTFLIVLNAGAFLGYQAFGWIADKKGRRHSIMSGLLFSAIATVIYVFIDKPQALLLFGPVFGFVTYGFFGTFGAYITELFPVEARATGANLAYNFARGLAMLVPFIIGAVAQNQGLALGLGLTAGFYLVGLLAACFLPETRKVQSISSEAVIAQVAGNR